MKCEYCGKEHDGSYGKGRFCSAYCARGFSSKAKRKEINEKVSKTLRERYALQDPEKRKRIIRKAFEKRHEMYLNRRVSISSNNERHILDITNKELEEYRNLHTVCEICGKPERMIGRGTSKPAKLCIDHNHETLKFRGLLCNNCNKRLGWFEKHKSEILKYLERG